MKIRYLIFSLSLFVVTTLSAQNSGKGDVQRINSLIEKDSLEEAMEMANTLRREGTGQQKSAALWHLSRIMLRLGEFGEVDSLIRDMEELHLPSDSLQHILDGRRYYIQGMTRYIRGNKSAALPYLLHSSESFQNTDDYDMLQHVSFTNGIIQRELAMYENAVKSIYLSLSCFEHLSGREADELKTQLELGLVLMKAKNHRDAQEVFEHIIENPRTPEKVRADALNNLGIIFHESENADSSLYFFTEAGKLYKQIGEPSLEAKVLANKGTIYFNLVKNYDSAAYYTSSALAMRKEMGDSANLALPMINMATTDLQRGHYERAKKLALQALELARKYEDASTQTTCYKTLKTIEKHFGNHKKALEYYENYVLLSDSILNESHLRHISELNKKYRAEQQEKRIALLERDNRIKDLNIQHETRLKRALFVLIILILLISVTVFLFYRQRLTNRLNMERKNRELATASALLRGQEDERQRIARELHDGLGNKLALLTHHQREYPQIAEIVREAADELRQISHNLMPGDLRKFGLRQALENLAFHWEHKRSCIIDLHIEDELPENFQDDHSLTLFRIFQELIRNAVTRGKADYILVKWSLNKGRHHIFVQDNGSGLEKKAFSTPGLGIKNIRRRVRFLGGKCHFHSSSSGTIFECHLSFRNEQSPSNV